MAVLATKDGSARKSADQSTSTELCDQLVSNYVVYFISMESYGCLVSRRFYGLSIPSVTKKL